jgi:hypothetical protein
MSFQWIIDNAAELSLNGQPTVGSTTTRSGVTRLVGRGGQPWVLDVRLPDGTRWSDYRQRIAGLENNRFDVAALNFAGTGLEWMFQYQGDLTDINNLTASFTAGDNTFVIGGAGASSGGTYYFRAGDLVQLGTGGYVYQVVADAAKPSSTITVHRAIVESDTDAADTVVKVGTAAAINFQCVTIPNWSLFAREQVSWNGVFRFVESIT